MLVYQFSSYQEKKKKKKKFSGLKKTKFKDFTSQNKEKKKIT